MFTVVFTCLIAKGGCISYQLKWLNYFYVKFKDALISKNGHSRPFALIKLARSLQRYLSIKYFILFEQWGLQKLTTFDTPLDEGYTLGQVILSSLFAKTGRIISPGSEKQMKELFHLKEEKRWCCYSMWKCTIHMVFLTVKHMRVIRKEILFIGHN